MAARTAGQTLIVGNATRTEYGSQMAGVVAEDDVGLHPRNPGGPASGPILT